MSPRGIEPRIAVTGSGLISSLGFGPDFVSALYSGATGIKLSDRIPGVTVADIGEFNPQPWLGNKGVRVLDRGTRLLCIAAQIALTQTGLSQEGLDQTDASQDNAGLGLICGTIFGGVHSIAAFDWTGITDGPALVSPLDFPNTVINAPAGQAAIKHKLRGVNSTICSGLASGLYAIHYAAEFLRFGRAKFLLAGGMEEVCDESALGFSQLGLTSPTNRIAPFGTNRDGTIAGEGAALWMLETEETALARGAQPILQVLGFGAYHDAHSMLGYQVRGVGAANAIRQALENSRIGPDKIACVIASANGSRAGDAMEALALAEVFGPRLTEIPICAPKAALGEAMGGSGALCAAVAGIALQRGELPPTTGFTTTEYGLKLLARPQAITGEHALINAFGCDGNNSSLVVRIWKN